MTLTTIKYNIKPDGNLEEEVKGVYGLSCQRISNPIENEEGYVFRSDYLPLFFITDSNPIEATI